MPFPSENQFHTVFRNVQFDLIPMIQEVFPQVGDDQSLAAQFGPVGHQCPVIKVIFHLLFKEITLADEKIRPIGDIPQGVGPLSIPGIGDDLSRTTISRRRKGRRCRG